MSKGNKKRVPPRTARTRIKELRRKLGRLRTAHSKLVESAKRGDAAQSVERITDIAKTYNEVRDLAQVLISMVKALEEKTEEVVRAKEELETFTKFLEKRVEARTRELKQKQHEVLEYGAMSAIHDMASVLGHEVRNPLAVINNSLYYIKTKLKAGGAVDPSVSKHINIIETEIQQANSAINEVLSFLKTPQIQYSLWSLNNFLEDLLAQYPFPSKVRLVMNFCGGNPLVLIGLSQMRQALSKIITNSVESMSRGGMLRVSTKEIREEKVRLDISDTGAGIPKNIIQKVFDPFFTTKKRSLGLGLPVARSVVQAHKGDLEIKSSQKKGTRVRILLPIARVNRPLEIMERASITRTPSWAPGGLRSFGRLAAAIAEELGHSYIGSQHLLLALTILPTAMRELLSDFGVTWDSIRYKASGLEGAFEDHPSDISDASLSSVAQKIVRQVQTEVEASDLTHLAPRRMLLAILDMQEGAAWSIIKQLGVEFELLREKTRLMPTQAILGPLPDLVAKAKGAGAVSFVNGIIKQAIRESCLVIVLERSGDGITLRFQCGEKSIEGAPPPRENFEAVSCRLKILGKMDIGDASRPQKGSFTLRIQDRNYSAKVDTTPTQSGERIVLTLEEQPIGRYEDLPHVEVETLQPRGGRKATAREARVVCFSGPKEGVGKTTVALNLALAWAGCQQTRKVLIVHLDPLCRQDVSYFLNVSPPTLASLSTMLGKDTQDLPRLLKGRIPISQWGVGVLPIASKRLEAIGLPPEALRRTLESLSESYDLFLDVDPNFQMQMFAFDYADKVFWVTLPHRAHLEATYNLFQELKALHYPLDRFEVVVNQADLPGALAPKEVDRFFGALRIPVLTYMPQEDLLPQYANSQKILAVESPHSNWVQALRKLLGRIAEIKPGDKS